MDEHGNTNVGLVDDEFERLGRRAGAELRLQPPADGPGAIVRTAHRRRTTVASVAASVTVAVVVTGLFVANARQQDEPAPIATVPPTTSPVGPATAPFVGVWVSTDTDGSSQTMEILPTGADDYEVVVRDDAATGACAGAPSTMVGIGRLATDDTLVIARPRLTCDDGTTPVIGPPPQEELADFTFVLDPATDQLVDGFGVTWRRAGANDEPIAPSPATVPALVSATSGGMWPQSTLDEVRAAQELADAGDPAATWQLDAKLAADEEPWEAEILTRFIEEGLGWEAYSGASFAGYGYVDGGGEYSGVMFIRCAPGQTNTLSPVYADAPPEIRGCAPTVDELTYETVSITATQPGRRGPSGIWVVDRWEIVQSKSDPGSLFALLYPDFGQVGQVVPPSEDEVVSFLQAFLQARVEGEGAEQFLLREPEDSPFEDQEMPLLYATTGGIPFEQFETQRLQGPVWPTGWTEYKLRLVAEDATVVEQYVHVVRHDDQLGLVYGNQWADRPTTENGQSVAVPYSFLDAQVTLAAAMHLDFVEPTRIGFGGGREHVVIAVDPFPVEAGCENGPAPNDAEALARSILADPDFETIGSVPVSVAGIDGLQIDGLVTAQWNTNWSLCYPTWTTNASLFRIRLYLIDYPGESAQVLTIAVIAVETEFERVLEEATTIVESLEFHTG